MTAISRNYLFDYFIMLNIKHRWSQTLFSEYEKSGFAMKEFTPLHIYTNTCFYICSFRVHKLRRRGE